MTEQPNVQDLNKSTVLSGQETRNSVNSSELEQPEIVKTAEKLSQIISPYFIILVALYLYQNNGLLGLLLMSVGFLSLFKISYQDVQKLAIQLKDFILKLRTP